MISNSESEGKISNLVSYACETLGIILDPAFSDACSSSYSAKMVITSVLKMMEGIHQQKTSQEISELVDILVEDVKLISETAKEQADAAYAELQETRKKSLVSPDIKSIRTELKLLADDISDLSSKQEDLLDEIARTEASIKRLKNEQQGGDQTTSQLIAQNLSLLERKQSSLAELNIKLEQARTSHSAKQKFLIAWETVKKGLQNE